MILRLASSNANKARELERAVPVWRIELLEADDYPPEDGETYYDNALIKARFGHTLAPDGIVLGEDSGIEAAALGGRPGVHSARWADDAVARLLAELDEESDRRARYVCELVALLPDGTERRGRGTLEGTVGYERRGSEGFGYDPVFIPEGEARTAAELGNEWKATNSHRARAARALLAAIAGAACLLATACGHASAPKAAHDPTPARVVDKCGDTSAARAVRPSWLHAGDGQRLYAISGGAGTTGVVLVPESPPGDICGWLQYIATLEHAGLRVLSLDYRGTGDSPLTVRRDAYAFGQDLSAAVAELREEGAKKVILAGASFGGAAVMAYGSSLDVDGVISFSGETDLPAYHVNAIGAVPGLRVPLLIVDARHDPYLSLGEAQRLVRRAGAPDKRTMFFPGAWHGWEIVEDAPYAQKARALILAWIRAHV